MITYLLLPMAMYIHLVLDLHRKHHGKPILHWLSATLTVVFSILFGIINNYFDPVHYWWQFAIFSLCIHFCFFDIIWNLMNGSKWFYNGDPNNPNRALTDHLWDYVPLYAQPLVRFWVLGVGIGVFYHLNLILGHGL